MGKTTYDVYRYSYAVVIVFGILGNILVIMHFHTKTKEIVEEQLLLFYSTSCDMWSGATDNFPFRLYQLVFCRRSPGYYLDQVLCFLLHISRFSSRRNRYDVDHFAASLSCYCASFKTWRQSTEIESHLWLGVRRFELNWYKK
jgi:hypothetical protein